MTLIIDIGIILVDDQLAKKPRRSCACALVHDQREKNDKGVIFFVIVSVLLKSAIGLASKNEEAT